MIERLWRRDALRVHLLSHIGVVVASAVVLVAGQPATAQESFDFEDPPYRGSPAGTVITGQDGFYIPVPDSQDGLVYTYADNALGLPANPSGGGKQFAGVTGGDINLPVPNARAQRDVVYGDGTGVWTVSFDIAATYIGELPSAQNIGSFSTQLFPPPVGEATFIALTRWTDPDTATNWDADYVWFDAGGAQLTEPVANAAFQGLDIDHWYRWSTTFNLDTNQILQVSITDLTTGVTSTNSPSGRYLFGGTGGAPTPTGFRLFGGSGGAAGNTLAFDNISIDLAGGPPLGACCLQDDSCVVLTEADCVAADGIYTADGMGCTFKTCREIPPTCGKGQGPCNEPHGNPGCEDVECCTLVCDPVEGDPFCCKVEWDEQCVAAAIELGCALGPGEAAFLATGSDDSIDGYMDVLSDGLGSEATAFNGGPVWEDHYNPVGGPLQNPGFTTTTFLYTDTERLSLTEHSGSFGFWGGDGMSFEVTNDAGTSDTNGDGIPDSRVVDFTVSGALSLDVTCTQHVERFLASGGTPVATWEVTYDITNTGGATTFRIVRWGDVDADWAGPFDNDVVGTGTNDGVNCDRFVHIGEDGLPNFTITLSTNQADAAYVGAKAGVNPDENDPDCPTFGAGTDFQIWNNFGFPACYVNHIANVGTDIDGESGQGPPGGDGSIGLQSTISLGAGQSIIVVYKYTYGAITPDGADCGGQPCPWDLDGNNDVGIGDLLIILAEWGNPYGIGDLLALLAAWGPCP